MSGARTSFYRPTGQSRRAVRSQTQYDHDVFEGLPIRRWNKQWMWVAKKNIPPPPPPELPLPKETHLLTPMSQTLLKAARNGTLGQPQDAEEEAKKAPTSTRMFQTNKWSCIPREDEPSEHEYLGRPPDTFSSRSRLVKKTVNGKVMIVEEVVEDLYPEVPAAAAVVEGAVAGTPSQQVKRRPPPPRRKPGRGRKPGFKKMVTFAEDGRALPTGEGTATPSGAGGSGADNAEGDGEDDVEMGDAEDGTPDDHDHDDHDGEGEHEGEHDVEPTPDMESTPVVSDAIVPPVKKEETAEPMAISSPPPAPVLASAEPVPISEIVEAKMKSPSPVPVVPAVPLEELAPREPTPIVVDEPAPAEPAPVVSEEPLKAEPSPLVAAVLEPEPVAEVVAEVVADPLPAPVVEPIVEPLAAPEPTVEAIESVPVPEPAAKSPTPPPPVAVEPEKSTSPAVNPLKRKTPPAEEEAGELVDKELANHEVSIAAAVAERESHDEVLSPVPPAPAAPSEP